MGAWRDIPQPPLAYPGAGQKQVSRLSKAGNLMHLMLRLQGAPTLSAANNTVANTKVGDEWGAIARIDLVANNSNVLLSMSGNDLWWYNKFFCGNVPRVTPTIGDATTANPSFDSVLYLPIVSTASVRPIDTALFTNNLSELTLEITFNDWTGVNSAATAWTTSPTVQVVGRYDLSSFVPPFLKKIVKTVQSFSASQNDARVDLPLISGSYRRFLINTNLTSTGTDTTGQMTNVQAKSGGTVFFDYTEAMVQQGGLLLQGMPTDLLETNAAPPVTYQRKWRRGTPNNERAWYPIECAPDGFLGSSINVAGLPEFYANMNLTLGGASQVSILSEQIFPLDVGK